MEPIRELGMGVKDVAVNELRPIVFSDFKKALQQVRPSVSKGSIAAFERWNKEFGSM
jgi:SpoVK/Ycf46/Vps4 family AAA+-type ATPase